MNIALWGAALAAEPSQLAVTYTVRFDLPGSADQVCAVTQVCDCALSWSGSGTLLTSTPDHLTFRGTWKVTSGKCNEAFALWTPPDGSAYHTVRLSPDRGTVLEWIAHANAADTTRFESDIKARGQVWLAEMNAPVDPSTHTATHFERDAGMVGPFQLTTEHHLSIQLLP